ncbi:MAG: amidase [Acetobacteraceae bacterium]
MEPAFLPAWRLAELIRGGAMSCLELLDHFIARIERLDGHTNAVVVRDFDRARERARLLDSQRRDGRALPLFGVPMTVKESFNLTGLPTTWGNEAQRASAAHDDALAVQRLTAAGAVVFGKTNVPVGLADWQSYNPIYGATSNPWNLAHTPGGSSGGSAAAIAAGFSALELGSDIGGSIRVPAHYCGVFGHKPSWGLCSGRGQSLVPVAGTTDIAVIGPLARSARDLSLALDAIAGPDPVQDVGRVVLPPPRAMRLADLRIAVWSSEAGRDTDTETTAHIDALADFLEREGATVSRTARPAFDASEAFQLYLTLLAAAVSARESEEILALMRHAKASQAADDMSANAIWARTVDMTHRDWLRLNERRYQLRRLWGAFFQDWDVLLCPVISTAALPHMQQGETWERNVAINGRTVSYNEMLFWPGITCGYHLPASTAPIALTEAGLPVGVQIVGPMHGDRMTLQVAELLEGQWRGFVPPPGWD